MILFLIFIFSHAFPNLCLFLSSHHISSFVCLFVCLFVCFSFLSCFDSDFMQLLKEFKILTGPVTGPFVSALLTTEESSLTFRRFVALLLKIGETLQPRYPKQDAFLALLETMVSQISSFTSIG